MAVVGGVIGGTASRAPMAPVVVVTSYYWHFVDVVWIALFTTIYVIR
jgi:heme/copper-type cytochrome/quinol oxidase subunit 3